MRPDSRYIPNFIRARSPQGLRRLMLLTNARYGAWVQYQDIQFVNGEWIAWYHAPLDTNEFESLTSGETQAKPQPANA